MGSTATSGTRGPRNAPVVRQHRSGLSRPWEMARSQAVRTVCLCRPATRPQARAGSISEVPSATARTIHDRLDQIPQAVEPRSRPVGASVRRTTYRRFVTRLPPQPRFVSRVCNGRLRSTRALGLFALVRLVVATLTTRAGGSPGVRWSSTRSVGAAQGGILYRENWEKGRLNSEWGAQCNNLTEPNFATRGSFSLERRPVGQGRWAARFQLPAGHREVNGLRSDSRSQARPRLG